ncbi:MULTISPECIES: hypothetical protein [unclassified Nocardiopsis]|uniref:hypothetical protein n=1 Tax=unclassified Nocardiopsis TaxID=2649073 RepID=UPI000E3B9A79|nr:hypothetical protein [Nocardiopsis sp. TNDT3]
MKIHISAEKWAVPLIALALLGAFVCVLLLKDVDPMLVSILATPLAVIAGGIAASNGRTGDTPAGQEQL